MSTQSRIGFKRRYSIQEIRNMMEEIAKETVLANASPVIAKMYLENLLMYSFLRIFMRSVGTKFPDIKKDILNHVSLIREDLTDTEYWIKENREIIEPLLDRIDEILDGKAT